MMKILYICPQYYYPSHLRSFADREVQALQSFAQVDLLRYNFSHLDPLGNLSWFISNFITLFIAMIKSHNYDILYLRDGDPFLFLPVLLSLPLRHRRWMISVIGVPSISQGLFSRLLGSSLWVPVYRLAFSRNSFMFVCENQIVGNYLRNTFLQGTLNGRVRILPLGISK